MIGATGDPMRGGRPIGLELAEGLTTEAFNLACAEWLDTHVFILKVNQFEKDRAQALLNSWCAANPNATVFFRVEAANVAQGAWSIEPYVKVQE